MARPSASPSARAPEVARETRAKIGHTVIKDGAMRARGHPIPRLRTERRRLLAPLHRALDVLVTRHAALLSPRVVLAVSGGPDSRALLESFASWRGRAHVDAHVVSVDHGTHPRSFADADDVVARAAVLALDGEVARVTPDKLDEATLRRARYGALARAARRVGARVVVTAHHAGDDAEGALLSLFGQGGGRGGAAMHVVAPLVDDEGELVVARPFLALSRETLALACTGARAYDIVTDARDRAGIGARAHARHVVLPALASSLGDVDERLARAARRARDDEDALLPLALALVVDERATTGRVRVSAGPRALMRRALHQGMALMVDDEDVGHVDPRASARAVDALLAAFGDDEERLARRADAHVATRDFALHGAMARVEKGRSGALEIVLTRPCRGGPQSA